MWICFEILVWTDQTIIQNLKSSKLFELSKYKKKNQIWTKKTPYDQRLWKTNKKGGKKKECNLPKPLPSFSPSFFLI